jgi:phenylalanyl-tRNA synthetase beta chain
VELVDIYRGAPLPPGHKSLAFRLTYQHPARTLGEKEVAQLRQRIIRGVEQAVGARLRR